LRATEFAALMMAATRAGAAGGTLARPPDPNAAASIARPARDPKACSSSRRTCASVGARRPLLTACRDAGLEAALDALAACPPPACRDGSGGGMYGGPVRHSAIRCVALEPQPAAARAAMQRTIVTPLRTALSMAAIKVCVR
jgi:hypothetical protein